MRVNWERLTVICGIAGALIIAAACVGSALAYSGKAGQPYSPLNHFVSELGEVGVSPWANVFNAALLIGGAGIAVALAGIATRLRGVMRYCFGAVGLTAGLSGMAVGLFPMNNFHPHALAALIFFNTGWIAVAIFSIYAYSPRQDVCPRWLAFMGLPCIASFLVFIFLIRGENLDAFADPSAFRPEVWPLTIFEWLVIAFVLVWIVAVSVQLNRRTADA
jgi:hypothetical membrane protein